MPQPTKKPSRLHREMAKSADYLHSIGALHDTEHAKIGVRKPADAMTETGERLLQAAKEALAIAEGRADPATYVSNCPQPRRGRN